MATSKTEILTALEINATTGEQIIRKLTADEIADRQAQAVIDATAKAERDAKALARQSALAKLKELGLTEAEIAAL